MQRIPGAARRSTRTSAIGMRFYNGKMFPANISATRSYRWSTARGTARSCRATGCPWSSSMATRSSLYTRFAEGWLRGMKPAAAGGAMIGDVWGRPADVLVMPDGALLVSDDKAGVVYRISYSR